MLDNPNTCTHDETALNTLRQSNMLSRVCDHVLYRVTSPQLRSFSHITVRNKCDADKCLDVDIPRRVKG